MPARITRHFLTVGDRRVHYRRAGSGPALALLHASPQTGAELAVQQHVFAEHFTTLAFDTPGFGLSDRLGLAQPESEDLADALADTLRALGVTKTGVYGRHTGASIAVEFAARHPDLCAMALTSGFPIYTLEQRAQRLGSYLAPLVPSFEGGHLLWLWFRFREQHVFWPWNAHDLAHRADVDVPDLDTLHRGVMAFLDSGDEYRIGYATAFRHRGLAVLGDLRVPVCFGNRRSDSVWSHHERLPDGVWKHEFPRDAREAAHEELPRLLQHPGIAPPAPPPPRPIPGRTHLDYLDLGDAQILLRSHGDFTQGVPVVVIHHAPGSSALYDDLVLALGASAPVLAFDLPGHGESDPIPGAAQTVAAWADATLRVLDGLGIAAAQLYGHGSGAAVAVELALRRPGRVHTLLLDAPIAFAESERDAFAARWLDGLGTMAPSWDAGHLLRAWHMQRDAELWFPWNDRSLAAARAVAPRLDLAALTLRLRETMKQPHSFVPAWRAALAYPFPERLRQTTAPCLLLTAAQDIFARCQDLAHAARPDAPLSTVDDTAAARAAAVFG